MHRYVVYPKIDKTGEEEKKMYYGTPVSWKKITEVDLAQEVSEQSSLTPEDVIAALSSVARRIQEHLKDGDTVNIKGIGMFSVSATSEACETPNECTPAKVKANRVCFKADNQMRSILEEIKYKRIDSKIKK